MSWSKEPGFYWVRMSERSRWTIVDWESGDGFVFGNGCTFGEDEARAWEWGERIDPPE